MIILGAAAVLEIERSRTKNIETPIKATLEIVIYSRGGSMRRGNGLKIFVYRDRGGHVSPVRDLRGAMKTRHMQWVNKAKPDILTLAGTAQRDVTFTHFLRPAPPLWQLFIP